jgi:hypothetical protein
VSGKDDVLIAGTTDYDLDVVALCQLLAEWSATNQAAGARVAHLLGPDAGGSAGGRNGGAYLNEKTVHDDRAVDLLFAGRGTDWFLVSAQDWVHKRHGDVVTEVG